MSGRKNAQSPSHQMPLLHGSPLLSRLVSPAPNLPYEKQVARMIYLTREISPEVLREQEVSGAEAPGKSARRRGSKLGPLSWHPAGSLAGVHLLWSSVPVSTEARKLARA